jgi:hypothetical protein
MNKGAIMKTSNVVKYLIILSFMLSSSFAIGEESGDIYLGLLTGYNNSIHKEVFYQPQLGYGNTPYTMKDMPKAMKFDKICSDFSIGVNLEQQLYKNKNTTSGLNYRIAVREGKLSQSRAEYEMVFSINPADLTDTTWYLLSGNRNLEMSYSIIDIKILYKLIFEGYLPFGLSVGPYLSVPFTSKTLEALKIGPREIIQENLSFFLRSESIKNINTLTWGLTLNAFIEYEFHDLVKATLEAGYSYPLSKFVKDSDWKIESYYANLIISFKLN